MNEATNLSEYFYTFYYEIGHKQRIFREEKGIL